MKQVQLGGSNWKASSVALGIMRMNVLSPEKAASVLDSAYDDGINFIDSADIYGQGKSEEVFGEALKQAKVNRGVSNFNPEQIALLQENLHQQLLIDQVQFSVAHTGMVDAGMHTNMADDRSVDHDGSLLPYLQRKHMTLQAWSPFQYGMFEGTFIDSPKFKALNDELQKVADHYHTNKNAIAVAWLLRHPVGVQVILGSMNPEHIKESAEGADITLTRQEWYDIYFAAGNDLP